MWTKIQQFAGRMLGERTPVLQFGQLLPATHCDYVRRGSKGDLYGCRWLNCQFQRGHDGPHQDPYGREFQSRITVRHIRKSQIPCEFVARNERAKEQGRQYRRCFRIEGHFGQHRDEFGQPFRSSTLDTDVFIYDRGRQPRN